MDLRLGDCLEQLRKIESNSIDSLVTDPPAGISFMGKEWDSDKGGRDGWIAWMTKIMRECHRVMKPGAHGLVWAIPRTSHWTATALEDAGFEVRDVVTHLFGSGFPKSLDISKEIDKAKGITEWKQTTPNPAFRKNQLEHEAKWATSPRPPKPVVESDEAKQWQGWGTALKPASEHWILVRKPCSEKTVAANVIKHGVGGINIDASRVGTQKRHPGNYLSENSKGLTTGKYGLCDPSQFDSNQGRFPANLVLSHSEHCTEIQCEIECAIRMLDEQSNETGGASRFFYCAKISTSERNAGLEDVKPKRSDYRLGDDESKNTIRERLHNTIPKANHHPTVKSKKLMSYLIKLITPPNGTVLDPFMGSGSTGIAAKENGFKFIGIEKEADYFEIAEKRILHAVTPG